MADLPVADALFPRARKVAGVGVAVLGGDDRERTLVVALLEAGYRVICAGRDLSVLETVAGAETAAPGEALGPGTRVVVGPMAGIAADGTVWSREPHPGAALTPQMLGRLPRGALWFSGKISGPVEAARREMGIQFIDLAEHDVLAVLNGVPSAEGAIMMAMQESPFCLHGSQSLVLGFGRTAGPLAMMLAGLRSRVTVVARSDAARARAGAMGYEAAGFEDLPALMGGHPRFCFNTVPALVLTAEVLAAADPGMLVVDVASRPGGTDFAAAARLGIKALLAPGLPGLVAPRTAGGHLAQIILKTLKERGL